MTLRSRILEALEVPRLALELLAVLNRGGRQVAFEDLYVELVAMEAAGLTRVEAICADGQRLGSAWALGALAAGVYA